MYTEGKVHLTNILPDKECLQYKIAQLNQPQAAKDR